MAVPSDPPAVTPAGFQTWAQNVSDTAQDHDTRIAALGASLWVQPRDFHPAGGVPLFETNRTGGVGWPGWFFDASSIETVQAATPLPAGWTTVDVDLYWSNGGAGAGDVTWQLSTRFVGDGEDTSAITASSNVTATAPAQYTLEVTTVGSGIAVTAGKLMSLRFLRFASDGGDTLANDAVMYGFMLRQAS